MPGLLTQEAPPGGTVTYTLTIPSTAAGTRAYYSGTQGDLQVEMGLYGAIIVLPNPGNIPAACTAGVHASNQTAQGFWGESDFRLAAAAYNHPRACYDREYLFQFSEIDPVIHTQALAQINDPARIAACAVSATSPRCSLNVPTEPYRPAYFMINGRSMPDDMDPNYAAQYPHQPYNGNPHMHPGELILLRIIGQGRWQHPFHEHGNHVRVLARDGNLILSQSDADQPRRAAALHHHDHAGPGDGRDLLLDRQGAELGRLRPQSLVLRSERDARLHAGRERLQHRGTHRDQLLRVVPGPQQAAPGESLRRRRRRRPCDAARSEPLRQRAVVRRQPLPRAQRDRPRGRPHRNDATVRDHRRIRRQARRGFAFMWHSHNEREITTNNIFPGGMLMMMLVDSREFVIDESK